MTGLLYITLIVTAVVVLTLVVYLVLIIRALWGAKRALAALAEGLETIRVNTDPLPAHMRNINSGLGVLLGELLAVNGHLEAVVGVAKQGGKV